ncbi:MAG: bifunctional adenosylcobinamide kinase/adenosylcobinamide-phosphate guanylyltransferase [Desulfovibrio sp.]|nr:bifunctional adenosylcobinamide kinase/adenosylcobinamide-phosphate guanylyltransferase [Desulfovibrio sp.]
MSGQAMLFVGGVRSGKSALAQRWAEACAPRRLYVATAVAEDAEMAARIARHRAERGTGWQCLEAPVDPANAIRKHLADTAEALPGVVLFDCVSLWIANELALGLAEKSILERLAALMTLMAGHGLPFGLVSLEAGLGMVPLSASGRAFQDVLGLSNQMLARVCTSVIFVSCGLPMALKGTIPEEICKC